MARMPKRQHLSSKPVRPSSQMALATTSSPSSTRLNTHVILALSFLVLSANARPLNVMGHEFNIGSFLDGDNLSASGLTGGITEQIAESVLKLFHLNGEPKADADEALLSEVVPASSPKADYPALTASGSLEKDKNVESNDSTPADQLSAEEKADLVHSFLSQNPAISMALGFADLMRKMRELFVDIAILEGEERGIHVHEDMKDEYLLEDAGEEESGLGLQLSAEEPKAEVLAESSSASFDEEQLQFALDLDMDDQVIIPGQFDQPESNRPTEHAVLSDLNPLVNPYAAISISAVLATMFVVCIFIGRHHYLTSQQSPAEDDMIERGGMDSPEPTELDEKSIPALVAARSAKPQDDEEEINEKTGLELDLPSHSGQTAEEQEAAQALALLIDVANAALSSSNNPVNILKTTAPTSTPKLVSAALENARTELSRTPQTRHLALRSLPQTPRSMTPALKITAPGSESPEAIVSESAASSYVSATSMIRAPSPYPALPRSILRIQESEIASGRASPTPSYVTAQASPASSFATAHESSTPIHRGISTPNRPFSPQLRIPGSLTMHDMTASSVATEDIGEVNLLSMMTRGGNGDGGMIPPAHLTQTALDLALMLPATEWIFQFIVIFIGWFGFLMRPVPTRNRSTRRL